MADMEGEERLAVRSMAYLALTYDHRLIDGADAARYLATIKRRLERPDDPRTMLPIQRRPS